MRFHLVRGQSGSRRILAAVACAWLAACAPAEPLSDEKLDALHDDRPAYQVERTVHQHLVPINPTQTEIGERQLRDLYGFLLGVGAKPGDHVLVAAREIRSDHRAQVERFLNRLGMQPDIRDIKPASAAGEDDGYDNAILVQYELFVTKDPGCMEWRHDDVTNFYNASRSNFGCASTTALQQQIAYPASLIRGRTLDFPEGDVAAEAVSRYRGRKTEDIEPETVSGGN